MRISDWSSDVCSSDLAHAPGDQLRVLRAEVQDQDAVGVEVGHRRARGEVGAGRVWERRAAANLPIKHAARGGERESVGRERVCQYVEITAVAGQLKKKRIEYTKIEHPYITQPI